LTTVDYFDRLLGLIKNLGRHTRVGQELIFSTSSTVDIVVGGAKSDFCASSRMLYI
jgi:hypothetical protein